MGAFLIQVDGGRVARVPNTFHREGAVALWETIFGGGSDLSFRIGITGIVVPDDPEQRPDHSSRLDRSRPTYLKLDVDTTYSTVMNLTGKRPMARPGGAASQFHAQILGGCGEQAAAFTVSENAGAARVVSGFASFTNQFAWTPTVDPDLGGEPYWLRSDDFAPAHGFPYDTPRIWPGTIHLIDSGTGTVTLLGDGRIRVEDASKHWGGLAGLAVYVAGTHHVIDTNGPTSFEATGDDGATTATEGAHAYGIRTNAPEFDAIEADPWRAATMPVGGAYLCAGEGPASVLVASALFRGPLRIPPQGTLRVAYEARLANVIEGLDGEGPSA